MASLRERAADNLFRGVDTSKLFGEVADEIGVCYQRFVGTEPWLQAIRSQSHISKRYQKINKGHLSTPEVSDSR